jgi:Ca-activated chloride channel family protein
MNELWERWDPGFFAPVWLGVGLLAMLAVVLLEIGAQRRRRQAIRLFAAGHLVPLLTGSVSSFNRMLKRVLLIAAVGLLFVAMARPHLLYRWSEETRTGLDVFLAVDCSKSMLTEDVNPNRLERAKLAVEDFADHLPNNRLGLIAFAGDAFLECPLTLDHDAFLSAVRDLDTDTIPRPGTDVAAAIEEGMTALKSQPNNLKFMILVTDGEDLEGRAIDAAKEAAQAGVKIYTVGVGTAGGGQIPIRDDAGNLSMLQDSTGQVVQSKLDESTLRQIAEITGAAYEPLGQRGEGLETIYHRYIEALPKQSLEEKREKIRFERFEWPLGLAVFFLMWEFLISDRARAAAPEAALPATSRPVRRRKKAMAGTATAAALLMGGLLLALSGSARAATADVAERDYKSGKFEDAAQKYREALEKQPDRRDLQYDRGDAAYKSGDFTEAEDAYRQALETPNLDLQENTYYNLGNAQFKDGEGLEKVDSKKARALVEQAIKSYESALKLKKAPDTEYNYEVAKKKLEQLKQQQQQKEEQNKQQSKGNNPEQQDSSGQSGQDPQNQPGQGQNNPQNGGRDQSQQDGQNDRQGDQGQGKDAQQSPDKNGPARQQARSVTRDQDQQDPGAKSREEAEALLDSLKDDEHRVTARSLNGGTEPPPTLSGKDW